MSPAKLLYAYSDETGNTGNNLFDADQPYFWTGTLISESDVDTEARSLHTHCLKITNQKELHGNALGLGGIEKIARKLTRFFIRNNLFFLFTRLEKRHLAATKFVDTLMDSGINKAVSNLHYGYRCMRLSLAVQLIQLLDEDDRRQFWAVYESADAEGFLEILNRVRERLKCFRSHGIYHERTEELLMDAIDWALCFPEPLLQQTHAELDSPNIVAFSCLVGMLHNHHQKTGARVGTFIHDEQNQFARFLKQSYGLLRGFTFPEDSAVSFMTDIEKMPTFSCELQIASSSSCIGLQFADVTLWLVKRFMDSGGAIGGDSRDLALSVIRNGRISNFTLADMQQEVDSMWQELQNKELSDDQITKGQEILADVEKRRIDRMKERPD